MDASPVSVAQLQVELRSASGPIVVDVRPPEVFLRSESVLFGALRRAPERVAEWASVLPVGREVVVYCEHGGDASRLATSALASVGRRARCLDGGLTAWRAAGGSVLPKPAGAPTRWITRERPKIDRIACPWLVSRFVDPEAEFRYVPASDVRALAEKERAIPFDVPDVAFSHDGDLCSFDAFVSAFRLEETALRVVASIVRGADTGRLALAPEAAGLLAVSLGLSRLRTSDHEMLRDGLVLYDALYLWAREGRHETHSWNPGLYR